MGEVAEMVINGDMCERCGDFLGDGRGFTMLCDSCYLGELEMEAEMEFEWGEENGASH